jgi:hypothetical protein
MREICAQGTAAKSGAKKSSPIAFAMEPDLAWQVAASAGQRPKNNHRRMITGIGTPSSQSNIPRPIAVSSISQSRR